MISFSLVDVKSITSDIPRSSFTEADLERLAELIIKGEGLIKPLVLKVIGAESYTVVDGHFEYYGAVRAREIDPRKGEMVNAFLISPKSESIITKQVEVIKGIESSKQQFERLVEPLSNNTNLESRLTNIEIRYEKQINEFRSEIAKERQILEDKLKEIESRIPQRIEPLNAINNLNKDDLAIKLQRSRIAGAEKLAKAIVDARQKKRKKEFEDYRDVIKSVKGLGEQTMLTIIDEWSRS